jgi:CRP-like cAMP-binding protein
MADMDHGVRQKTTRGASARRFVLFNAFVDQTMTSLSHMDALIWVVLYRHARPDRSVCVSAGRLAEMAGARRETIVRSLRRLRDEGLITRIRRGGQDGTPTTYKIQPYNLRSPAGEQCRHLGAPDNVS